MFSLQIVTPDGLVYNDEAKMVKLRIIDGDIAIRPRHIDFVSALGMGECRVDIDDNTSRYAACMGGMVTVLSGKVWIVATTFEWLEDIDRERVETAKMLAEEILDSDAPEEEKKSAMAHLKRAMVRLGVSEKN